jgi:hypothetical protein
VRGRHNNWLDVLTQLLMGVNKCGDVFSDKAIPLTGGYFENGPGSSRHHIRPVTTVFIPIRFLITLEVQVINTLWSFTWFRVRREVGSDICYRLHTTLPPFLTPPSVHKRVQASRSCAGVWLRCTGATVDGNQVSRCRGGPWTWMKESR